MGGRVIHRQFEKGKTLGCLPRRHSRSTDTRRASASRFFSLLTGPILQPYTTNPYEMGQRIATHPPLTNILMRNMKQQTATREPTTRLNLLFPLGCMVVHPGGGGQEQENNPFQQCDRTHQHNKKSTQTTEPTLCAQRLFVVPCHRSSSCVPCVNWSSTCCFPSSPLPLLTSIQFKK